MGRMRVITKYTTWHLRENTMLLTDLWNKENEVASFGSKVEDG